MSVVPLPRLPVKRRIGDILLEGGFASEAEVARAVAEQEQTGQPLGQILVQHSVITRLELASALAEQWSDQSLLVAGPPAGSPDGPAGSGSRTADDRPTHLHHAEAAAGVASESDAHDLGQRLAELAGRIDATISRTEQAETTLALVAENVEVMSSGIEETFGAFRLNLEGVTSEVTRIENSMVELAARPPEAPLADPSLAQRLEALDAGLLALGERPAEDAALRATVAELGAQIDAVLADRTLAGALESLADLGLKVEALADQASPPGEREAQAALLADVRVALAELTTGAARAGEVDSRLGELEGRIGERLDSVARKEDLETLAARVETTSEKHKSIVSSIDALALRLSALAARADGDQGLESRLAELEQRLETGLVRLASDVKGMRQRDETESGALGQRVEELGAGLDAVSERLTSLAEMAASVGVEELAARVEALATGQADQTALIGEVGRARAADGERHSSAPSSSITLSTRLSGNCSPASPPTSALESSATS